MMQMSGMPDTRPVEMKDYMINWNYGPLGLVLRPDLGADMPPVVAQVLPGDSVAAMAGVGVGDMLITINGKKTTKMGYEKAMRLLYRHKLPVMMHFRVPHSSAAPQAGAMDNGTFMAQSPNFAASGANLRQSQRYVPGMPMPPSSQMQMQQMQQMQMQQQTAAPSSQQRRQHARASTRAAPVHQQLPQDEPQMFGRNVRSDSVLSNKNPETRRQKLLKQFTVVWEDGSLGFSFRPYAPGVNVPTVDLIGARGKGRNMDEVCVNDVLISINGEKTKSMGVEKVLRMLHILEKPVVMRFHKSSHRIERVQPKAKPRKTQLDESLLERSAKHEIQPIEEEPSSQSPVNMQIQLHSETTPRSGRSSAAVAKRGQSPVEPRGQVPRGMQQSPLPVPAPRPLDAESAQQQPKSNGLTQLTLQDAMEIVARSSGESVESCVFAGVPLRQIQEGTMKAQLLMTYAKACVAKQRMPLSSGSSHSSDGGMGNALAAGRSNYMSFSLKQDHGARSMTSMAAQQRPPIQRSLSALPSADVPMPHDAQPSISPPKAVSLDAGRPPISGASTATVGSTDEVVTVKLHYDGPHIDREDEVVDAGKPNEKQEQQSKFGYGSPVALETFDLHDISAAKTPLQDQFNMEERTTEMFALSAYTTPESKAQDANAEDKEERYSREESTTPPLESELDGDHQDKMVYADLLQDAEPEEEERESETQVHSHEDDEDADEQPRNDDRTIRTLSELAEFEADQFSTRRGTDTPAVEEEHHEPEEEDAPEEDEEEEEEEEELVKEEPPADALAQGDALVRHLCASSNDLGPQLIGKSRMAVLLKKQVVEEIQDILDSLEMELQFERHSHMGIGRAVDDDDAVAPEVCFQCGKSGQLAALAVEGKRELYCQDCWDLSFFSEVSPRSMRAQGTALHGTHDFDAMRYTRRDGSIGMGETSTWSHFADVGSERDSNLTQSSTATDRNDEVWL